ncbi:unnamed protein product [Caenorhabditis auriculariae]|uniref:Uncharacterized protein n=1 Tax=Caenorhabditis auriculariae TaxID=2777116 RepID=A0A8S1GWR1_9PELO|nr:unnamed protein product [Caenorhabditis auriculariae]
MKSLPIVFFLLSVGAYAVEVIPDEHPEYQPVELAREFFVVRPPSEAPPVEASEEGDADEEWKSEQNYAESSMGKRSIALGRTGFRPGKRSAELMTLQNAIGYQLGKRSMAIGRLGLRPGKRSMDLQVPMKRSMAYGRQGFRPGKRSASPTANYRPAMILF